MAKITLADGMTIEGTAEELHELAKAFGEVAEATEKEVTEDFDLRTKDEAEETFEEGDVVRVTGETYYGDFEEGTIAIVSYFDEHKTSGLARVVIETEDDIDRTSAENLELVAKRADRKDLAE